jgi:hypothetical protein
MVEGFGQRHDSKDMCVIPMSHVEESIIIDSKNLSLKAGFLPNLNRHSSVPKALPFTRQFVLLL